MAIEYKDYYKILGIERGADAKAIKSAFRKLARKYHPDVNTNKKDAEAKFKEINEAYEVLSDEQKRKKYDQFGADWERYQQAGGDGGFDYSRYAAAGGSTAYTYGTGGMSDEEFSDFFETLFGGSGAGSTRGTAGRGGYSGYGPGFSTKPRALKGEHYEQPVEISLEEAYNGTKRILQMQVHDVCPSCGGDGVTRSSGTNGRTELRTCPTCMGEGHITRSRQLEVKIPAGVTNGSRVKLAGQGGPGRNGGPAGDLYLIVTVQQNSRFERDGENVRITVPVDLYTAMLGGEVEVPTPRGGRLALRIPAETQNGRVFRLGGQGMPVLGNNERKGDLLAKLEVVLPTSLSDYERERFEELRELRES